MTKRAFDVITSLMLLIVLSPVMLCIAAAIAVTMGRPVLFRQRRPGRNEKIFVLYKFRSMKNCPDTDRVLLSNASRVTSMGRFLRKTSLDELPQLWNVLKGDMSLVGPRPLYIDYLPYYTGRERRRHDVLPGITGLAQVNGRNTLSWDDRLELDVQYVEKHSWSGDIRILLRTAWNVVMRSGVIDVPGVAQAPLSAYRESQREINEVNSAYEQHNSQGH